MTDDANWNRNNPVNVVQTRKPHANAIVKRRKIKTVHEIEDPPPKVFFSLIIFASLVSSIISTRQRLFPAPPPLAHFLICVSQKKTPINPFDVDSKYKVSSRPIFEFCLNRDATGLEGRPKQSVEIVAQLNCNSSRSKVRLQGKTSKLYYLELRDGSEPFKCFARILL